MKNLLTIAVVLGLAVWTIGCGGAQDSAPPKTNGAPPADPNLGAPTDMTPGTEGEKPEGEAPKTDEATEKPEGDTPKADEATEKKDAPAAETEKKDAPADSKEGAKEGAEKKPETESVEDAKKKTE